MRLVFIGAPVKSKLVIPLVAPSDDSVGIVALLFYAKLSLLRLAHNSLAKIYYSLPMRQSGDKGEGCNEDDVEAMFWMKR